MDDAALATLVPDLMTAHRGIDWQFIETTGSFAIEIRPTSDPRRYARVYVSDSTEVFTYTFAGHEAADFAYEFPDKQETLTDQISEAVAAVYGPTQVVLDWAGDDVVRSGISHYLDGEDPTEPTMDWPLKRLWWWAHGKRLRREILRFPAIPTAK